MNPSPLRYPGGKYKLYPYVAKLIEIYHQSSLHQRYLSHNRQYGVKLYDAIRS